MYMLERCASPGSRTMFAVCQSRAPLERVRRGLGRPPELRLTYVPCPVERYLRRAAGADMPCLSEKAG